MATQEFTYKCLQLQLHLSASRWPAWICCSSDAMLISHVLLVEPRAYHFCLSADHRSTFFVESVTVCQKLRVVVHHQAASSWTSCAPSRRTGQKPHVYNETAWRYLIDYHWYCIDQVWYSHMGRTREPLKVMFRWMTVNFTRFPTNRSQWPWVRDLDSLTGRTLSQRAWKLFLRNVDLMFKACMLSALLSVQMITKTAAWHDSSANKMISIQVSYQCSKSSLEAEVSIGHKCIFLPKLHCELNPIEMVSGSYIQDRP